MLIPGDDLNELDIDLLPLRPLVSMPGEKELPGENDA